MESDKGKLFIGGISWDTNEDRLREYFSAYGEVVEAVIMKDRTTGRARGFGFVVFSDSAAAERVVAEKHKIDGRVVEAKKAVPRDDLQALNRLAGGSPGAPSPSRTKKIFVGGLASTVTESDFRKYFEQFGTITDVVVMYDHNTQRPRGFGFITYDSEDAVDKVLLRTFHELNGKMVEVKRAVPKELSPGPSVRSPIVNFSHGLNRMSSFLGNHMPGYNSSSIGSYGGRMDPRIGGIPSLRSGAFPGPFSPGIYPRTNIEQGPNLNYNESMNYGNSILTHGRGLNPYLGANSGRFNSPMAYGAVSGGMDSHFTSTLQRNNVWGTSFNYTTNSTISGDFLRSPGGRLGVFGNNGTAWDSPAQIQSNRGSSGSYGPFGLNFGGGENEYEFASGNSRRINVTSAGSLPYSSANAPYERGYPDLYGGDNDTTWRLASSELDGSSSFDFGISNHPSDAADNGSGNYIANYSSVIARSS